MLATGGRECIQRAPRPARHRTPSAARWLLADPPGWRIGHPAGARPAPPGHHHHDARLHRSSATVLHCPAFPPCPLSHESPKQERAAPTIPPCETQSRRRTLVLPRHRPESPPLLAFWLPYGPQEPIKQPQARYPMSAASERRSGAVLRPGRCGAGRAVSSGCK